MCKDIHSPEPELLYYRGPEDQETPVHQLQERNEEMTALSWDIRGPQEWYNMYSSMPFPLMSTTQMKTLTDVISPNRPCYVTVLSLLLCLGHRPVPRCR